MNEANRAPGGSAPAPSPLAPAASAPPDRPEIVIRRVLDAPRELVFEALTDPEQVVRWWGPTGFTTTVHEMDVRQGGVWSFTMHGPDGTDYPNRVTYQEVVRPERLRYTQTGGVEGDEVRLRVTVTLAALGEKTEIALRTVFESVAERDRVAEEYGAIEGGEQTLLRLAEHLEGRS